jgi:hypothetical protein
MSPSAMSPSTPSAASPSAAAASAARPAVRSRGLTHALALAALGLVVGGAVVGPVPSASAQPGMRVCGYFRNEHRTKSDPGGNDGYIEVAYVAKVLKGSDSTCGKKRNFIAKAMSAGAGAPRAQDGWWMATCETVSHDVHTIGDICRDMPNVNYVYRVDPRLHGDDDQKAIVTEYSR